MERFVLPGALAGNQATREDIRRLLKKAEDAQQSIWEASKSFARDLLTHGDRRVEWGDVKKSMEQVACISLYWSSLEPRFHQVLRNYTLECDSDEIEREWLVAVRDALRGAWVQHRASVALGDAWAIRALVRAEVHVDKKLKELNGLISNLKEVVA